MVKKIDVSAHTGDSGIALIHQRVNDMGFVWHERHVDAGIDGMIELRNPATGEVANRHLLVQSKASERRFAGESDQSFHYLCEDRDIDYWMNAPLPVLLVCSHPSTREAWWAHVQSWFADPVRRSSRRIDFDKITQRFTAAAAQRLLNLADPHGFAHTPVAEQRPERLESNLLEVTHVPEVIFSAPTAASPGEVVQALREHGRVRLDWVARGGRLYTLLHPEEIGLGHVATGPVDAHTRDEWLNGGDPDRHRQYVRLLGAALRQHCVADLLRHPDRHYLYFKATPKLRPRALRGDTGRSRKVFYGHTNKKTGQINYYIHAALDAQFLHLDGAWYCAMNPTWHFTRDGYRESIFAADLVAGRKSLDRNLAVLGHVRMWAAYLRGEENLLSDREDTLSFGHLVSFDADRGVDDAAWAAARHPAEDAAATPDGPGGPPPAAGPDVEELLLFGDAS